MITKQSLAAKKAWTTRRRREKLSSTQRQILVHLTKPGVWLEQSVSNWGSRVHFRSSHTLFVNNRRGKITYSTFKALRLRKLIAHAGDRKGSTITHHSGGKVVGVDEERIHTWNISVKGRKALEALHAAPL